MEKEREDREFEREENERLQEAFRRFDSLFGTDRGADSVIQDEDAHFEEDEYEYIIDKYIDLGNVLMAQKASKNGFEAYPFSSSLLVKFCDSLVISKEFDKAMSLLDRYKDSFPPSSDIYLSYSRAYIGKKDFETARDYYSLALETETSPEDVCDSIHTLAQDCMENENWSEALFYLDKTAELTKEWNRKHESNEDEHNIASFYFDYAFCCEKIGKEDSAAELYQKCLDIDPFNDIVWHNLGIIYGKKNVLQKAYEAFDYAIALNGNNASARFNMGQMYLECEENEKAKEQFEECCKLEKDNPDSIASLALTYYLTNDLNQAEILYRKALIFDPEHKMAKTGLKEVQTEKKMREKYKSRHKDSNNDNIQN